MCGRAGASSPPVVRDGSGPGTARLAGIYENNVLLADDFYKYAFLPPAVEFAVKDLLPRAEVELAVGDGNHDLAAHDLALVMGIGVVFAGAVVVVSFGRRIERREFLEPLLVIMQKTRLIIVDENAGGNVHRIDEAQTLENITSRTHFSTCGVMFTNSIRSGKWNHNSWR